METKRELYNHLRNFASQGHSVVFLSSELEEFIGLCSRVVVVRHGSIFESFSADDIDPDRILEAMFGQTGGDAARRETAGPREAQEGGSDRAAMVDFENEKRRVQAKARNVRRIRIVDSDAEAARRADGSSDHDESSEHASGDARAGRIKIVYSDD